MLSIKPHDPPSSLEEHVYQLLTQLSKESQLNTFLSILGNIFNIFYSNIAVLLKVLD
jgi:hypothetical protein